MKYRIDARDDRKHIADKPGYLSGEGPQGERIRFTNYYMERNGKPYFGICGEFHYCRYNEEQWEDELLKMKMGGINILCTYIFWNVHEEIQGVFDWQGRRNLRRFIELCRGVGLEIMIRIGPFGHGEMRNGGLPDWLYGRPFDVRSNDEAYLTCVRAFYEQIGLQVQGLLFKQGGPIIGTQIENEHGHSAAQWALTTGVSKEWMTQGLDGNAHLLRLKEMAIEAGIDTPIYTCTGWGGANTPVEDMLALWGGYSHWPWIYYETDRFGDIGEHPATPEYIFRDKHNNAIPRSYNFEPRYAPEDYPYACCEMGGGMTPFYKYRFDFPYESVPAMTLIKVAEGCNLIGYYMYHGGSNPKGKRDLFLNDPATPKISYDFNACIGEFGQTRESYHRTRLQHYFFQTFAGWLSRTKTILPGDTSRMEPTDTESLRYAVRASEGAGLLFVNNFQDHAEMHNLCVDGGITVETREGEIRFPIDGPLKLDKDGYCMLPYRFDLDGILLESATAQPVTRLEHGDESYYFFVSPKGMPAEYIFASVAPTSIESDGARITEHKGLTVARPAAGTSSVISVDSANGRRVHIVTLSHEEGARFWKESIWGAERVVLTDGNLLVNGDRVKLEITGADEATVRVFPDFDGLELIVGGELLERKQEGIYAVYRFRLPGKKMDFGLERVKRDKAVLSFPPDTFDGVKEVLLPINYTGDIGYAFIDGELVHDHFSNGNVWEIGLRSVRDKVIEKGMYLYISPIRKGSTVNSHTTMAGWSENAKQIIAELGSVTAVAVRELVLQRP